MKQGVLRTLALAVLLLVISPGIVYAEETIYEIHHEPMWQALRANVGSPQEFFFRVGAEVTVNQVNERSWFWIADPMHMMGLAIGGFDMSFFLSVEDALLSMPQMEYLFETWHWDASIFRYLDMPTMHFTTSANTQIEFDFYAESLMVLSWGGEALREVEMAGGFIAPGARITLPGSPSFTAVYFRVAYGPGNSVESGHVLLLIEVLDENGRRAPAYSFNPLDHIPSDFAAQSVYRAIELGILPEFMDRSLRRPINRLEFATLAVYLHEAVTQREVAGRVHFNDTTDINAEKMGFLGVMTENEFGNFSPGSPVTREQAALLIIRLATVSGMHLPVVDGIFADSEDIAGWAQEAALQVFGAGIIAAPYGLFEPNRVPTREETIVMLVRLFDLLVV